MFIIRDMETGNLVGALFMAGRFTWFGTSDECNMDDPTGAEYCPDGPVVQKVYKVIDLPPTGSGSTVTIGAPAYDSQGDRVTRSVTLSDTRSVDEVASAKAAAINVLRDQKRYPGNVATGLGWDVDLRNAVDESNIVGKVVKALTLKAISSTDTITFVGADNEAHDLTSDQMIAVGTAVDAYVSSVYGVSWFHKNAVAEIVDGAGSDATKIAAIDAYDIAVGW